MIKAGTSVLVAASTLVFSFIFAPESAQAQCAGPADNTICTQGGNPYAGGIDVDTGNGGGPINITLQPGVNVVIPAPGINAVNAANWTNTTSASANISIIADGVVITNTANPGGNNQTGLRIQSSGDAVINATNTTIDVNGTASDWAILAFAMPNTAGTPHLASVVWSGPGLSSSGIESGGIQVDNRGNGDAILEASGNVTIVDGRYGLLAHDGDPFPTGTEGFGNATVLYHSGTIDMSVGNAPRGILAWAGGDGSATAITDDGTVINTSGPVRGGPGVYVFAGSATAANNRAVTAIVASRITSIGPADASDPLNRPNGIRAFSALDAPIIVEYTGPGITTQGGNGIGIVALSGGGGIDVTSTGPITTSGSVAMGIFAESNSQIARFAIDPEFGTVPVFAGTPSGAVTVSATAAISTSGAESHGIWASSTNLPVEVNATQITTSGEFSAGIQATGTSTSVNIAAGGSVMGGWQPSATGAGPSPDFGMPAAGVMLGAAGGTATLTNNGSVGALSDRAVASVDPYRAGFTGDINIVNNGTITGYVTLGAGNDTFQNLTPNSFDIRNFADTNGDGSGDTKAVAISDFGAGNDLFLNAANGVVRLLPVTGETTTDATGYYVPTTGIPSRPLEASFYDLNRAGVVQGQLVNLEEFDNAGIVDLRGPAVGNTLVITANATAGGAGGSGLYVSNGGQLLLNAVFKDGIPLGGQTNSFSDMLIVDGTQLGTGATVISVTNVGGSGALTPGNGIELVEVRNKAASAPGVFVLKGDFTASNGQPAIVVGAFAYSLFQNGVGADSADGNWYLRSLGLEPTVQPAVPVYEAYPQNLLALNGLPTMQQRVGNRQWARPPETVFCKDPAQDFKCPVTDDEAKYYADGQTVIEGGAIWGRIEGTHSHIEPGLTTTDTDYDTNLWKLQAGFDGLLHEADDGSKLIGGITAHYGQAKSDVNSPVGDGDITSDGYGFGGTLTWLDTSGFYVDAQAALTWFDSDLSSDSLDPEVDGNDGFGYALSLEAGQTVDLDGDWALTPQAQLIYSQVDFDSFTDAFGTEVSLENGDSLRGRLGLSADWEQSWKDDDGKTRRNHAYGIANLYYEFLDGTEVDVAGLAVESRPERLWGGLGLGGTHNWDDDKYSIYGEVWVDTSLESFGDSYALNGTAGFRVRW
ncbi:autotransporter outer membrane beta-barrel domain-containing protein [Nordella sp. HKS 07]|uniref:autotransporter family protein n=1 Tax=Nordella sp. HKS 07 TaxID=2712222 RepID=UPI0013E15B85|nr:autotransporter outer membrane beta-barrel domain-containing protein [Nordella sp. HKS 07]QIG48314.1 autotransporter outer membrane beta-barrel domain-containing protein [Nordella sp. HKS 07]